MEAELVAAGIWEFYSKLDAEMQAAASEASPQCVAEAGAMLQPPPVLNQSTAKGGSYTARSICAMRECAHRLGFGTDRLAHIFQCAPSFFFLKGEDWIAKAEREWRDSGCLPGVAIAGGVDAVRAAQEVSPSKALDIVCHFHCRTCVGDDAVEQFAADHAAEDHLVARHGAHLLERPLGLRGRLRGLLHLRRQRVVGDEWRQRHCHEGRNAGRFQP